MKNSKKIEEIISGIDANKEILSTMPRNNEKNKIKYLEKIKELQKEYEKYEEEILNIFNKRFYESTDIEINKEIDTLKSRLNTIENVIFLLSDEKTSYEKMELDRHIYKLGKYYKGNLEDVNKQISVCIKKFSDVGIELSVSDFNYSIYVKEYMETFFEELKQENINSKKMKSKFEEIYWKCPDIILHIELNFRNIYLNKENVIDKYFEKEKNELLKKWDKSSKDIRNSYLDLKRQKLEKMSIDKKILLDNFLNGKLNTKNFTKDKIKSNYLKILPQEIAGQVDENEEIIANITKFLNSLYEYRNYMNFKFIVDDMKEFYKEKDKYKKVYIDTKKKIDVLEKKLQKINKKLKGKKLFGGKKENTKQTSEQNQIINDIKEAYKELDLNKFYQKISSDLTDNSTIYDCLNLASGYYNYLISCMIKNEKSITQDEMDSKIAELREFLNSPYNTIINNITILEDKDIALIIKDRYKLLNFIVEKEDLALGNVDSLISLLEDIETGINLKKADLEIDEIEQLSELKKLIKK